MISWLRLFQCGGLNQTLTTGERKISRRDKILYLITSYKIQCINLNSHHFQFLKQWIFFVNVTSKFFCDTIIYNALLSRIWIYTGVIQRKVNSPVFDVILRIFYLVKLILLFLFLDIKFVNFYELWKSVLWFKLASDVIEVLPSLGWERCLNHIFQFSISILRNMKYMTHFI